MMKIMKNVYVLEIFIVILLSTTIVGAQENHSIYRAYVDGQRGFYDVMNLTNNSRANYYNYTLIINIGDTVIWSNEDSADEALTIVSSQKLWTNKSGYLKYSYKRFNYTFKKSGKFDVYIRQNPRLGHQNIIVKPSSGNNTKKQTYSVSTNITNNGSKKNSGDIKIYQKIIGYNSTLDKQIVLINITTGQRGHLIYSEGYYTINDTKNPVLMGGKKLYEGNITNSQLLKIYRPSINGKSYPIIRAIIQIGDKRYQKVFEIDDNGVDNSTKNGNNNKTDNVQIPGFDVILTILSLSSVYILRYRL